VAEALEGIWYSTGNYLIIECPHAAASLWEIYGQR
jgi:hypothetical protein